MAWLIPFCIGCWVVPLIAFAFFYSIINAIVVSYQQRGVGKRGVYCASCRFDLRGNTEPRCPECGLDLYQPPRRGLPFGGVLVDGLERPMPLLMRVLVFLLVGFGPTVAAFAVLGLMLPINYQTTVQGSLGSLATDRGATRSWSIETQLVYFQGTRERSWLGDAGFMRVTYGPVYGSGYQLYPRSDAQSPRAMADAMWQDAVRQGRIRSDAAQDQDARYDEFVEVFLLVATDQIGEAQVRSERYFVEWQERTRAAFHPAYVLFYVVAVVAAMVLLVMWARRDGLGAQQTFERRLADVRTRFDRVLETNRSRIGQ